MINIHERTIVTSAVEVDRCSIGCTDSLVTSSFSDLFEGSVLASERQTLKAEIHESSELRYISLRIPIYERLIRESEARVEQLAAEHDRFDIIKREYQQELEFLRSGLAQAVAELAEKHGVQCLPHSVEVLAMQAPERSHDLRALPSLTEQGDAVELSDAGASSKASERRFRMVPSRTRKAGVLT